MNRATHVPPTPAPQAGAALTEADLRQRAAEVLDANWERDHTVPSRALYPHQWSWDAAFIAVGLAHHAPERAWWDLRSLFAAQWADGRVPHIVFDPNVSERDYFPGPAFWDAPPVPGRLAGLTTGIVQPPVHAVAAWEVYRRATDRPAARAELTWLYPRLVRQQEYLFGARDVGGAGLASIVHPWESGLDNSPAWDRALAAVPADLSLLRRHRRQDTNVADSSHRPTDTDYARYIALAAAYRDSGYADAGLAQRHLFLVECPAFNAILGAAEHALADIAEVVGADPAPHRDRAEHITKALLDRLLDPATGMFHARDVRTGELTPARCVSGLLPLILPGLPEDRVAALLAEAGSGRFGYAGPPVPSYDRTAPDFDRLRYWRGPVWINVNWLLWRGLRTHGHAAAAGTLRTAMLDVIRRGGCYEYFDPIDGAGIGAAAFSWTAALALDLLAAD
ncbi:MGH1-like glycoside hydrolase domain-containing protein [Phytohabitans rumicis]|uniref:MGH1-like glycoside hydrolase domain-containing protein n=1 Tax=Phytohabitans rumicis TaxID=1076125 RepID=UPI0035309538